MEGNTRPHKVARLIQKEMGGLFQSRGMATYQGAMITVSEVRMSPDLALARIYLSIFPSKNNELILKQIESENKSLRGELGRIVRHQLRIVPELHFYLDETLDRLAKIDELLK